LTQELTEKFASGKAGPCGKGLVSCERSKRRKEKRELDVPFQQRRSDGRPPPKGSKARMRLTTRKVRTEAC